MSTIAESNHGHFDNEEAKNLEVCGLSGKLIEGQFERVETFMLK